MIDKIVKQQQKYPILLTTVIVIIVALFAILATGIQLDTKLSSMIPSDGEYNANRDLMKVAFDQGDGLLIIIKRDKATILENAVTDLQGEEVNQYIELLQDTISQSQYVKQVTPVESTPEYAQFAVIVYTPDKIGGGTLVKDEINYYIDQVPPPPGIEVQLTGLPLLIDKIGGLLITDNIFTIALTLVVIFLFLWWYFRSVRFVIAVVLSPVISLIVLAGAMVVFGIAITIPLAAVGVLVLGLGVDYSIHIATHYQDERKTKKHSEALESVIKELQIPITASFLTTLAGFMALTLGVSPSTQSQGIVLSLAISIIFAVSFAIFPLLLTLLAKDVHLPHNKLFDKIKNGLAKLAVYQAHHPKAVLLIFIIITIFMFGGLSQVEFSTSNSNWIPDTDPLSIAFRESEYEFGETDTITIIIQSTDGDLRDVQTARDINKIQDLIESIPNVDSVTSPFTHVSYDKAELFDQLTYERRQGFNEDYTISVIQVVTADLNEDSSGKSIIIKELRYILDEYPIHHATTNLYGDPIQFEELSDSLQQDTMITTIIGIILVFLIAVIIYASFRVGFIALIPILIGLIWAIGLMGYLGVPFTSLSTGIVSLVLGIGIDFSIHLVDSIRKYIKNHTLDKALQKALTSSGTSILLASVTTFIGFMALSFSQLLGTQRLGWSLAIAVASVFVVSITIVPVIMRLTTKPSQEFKEKMKI